MRRLITIFLISILTAAFSGDIEARAPRTAKSIKKERTATAKDVEKTRKKITQNTAETKRQLNRLATLEAQSKRQSQLIAGMKANLAELTSKIQVMDDSIAAMQHDIDVLRAAYAENLRAIRARRQQMSTMAMLFSSKSFTEAYKRYRYIQEFDRWQKVKTGQITQLSTQIRQRRDEVEQARIKQNAMLDSLSKETVKLQATKSQTETLVGNLKKQGSSLKKALDEKQRQLRNLDAELDRIIAEEARKAEEAARKAEQARLAAEAEARRKAEAEAAATDKPTAESKQKPTDPKAKPDPKKDKKEKDKNKASAPKLKADAADIALTGSFEANKGKLPAPVTGDFSIVSHFGLNVHPDLANVKLNNNGIDIETVPSAQARAVFDGEVSSVFRVSGYHNVVMLRHGNYLTVYAGIDKLSVKKGDKVKAGQTLGTIYSDSEDSGRSVLHFEVRRERTKLNPEEWLRLRR